MLDFCWSLSINLIDILVVFAPMNPAPDSSDEAVKSAIAATTPLRDDKLCRRMILPDGLQ